MGHWLLAVSEADDGQACMAEPDGGASENPLLIRPAVRNCGNHAVQQWSRILRRNALSEITRKSTHAAKSPTCFRGGIMPEKPPRCVNLDQDSGTISGIWSQGKDLFKNNFAILLKF
jgi:hypothetical protein